MRESPPGAKPFCRDGRIVKVVCQYNFDNGDGVAWTQYMPAVPAVVNIVLREERWCVVIHVGHHKEPSDIGYGVL